MLAVEWNQNAVDTFRLNFRDVLVYHGDIAALSAEEVIKLTGLQLGQLDVLDGSPPCQGFSTAGNRILEDPRNNLFREYVRLLKALQPKVLVMENVSGMVKGKMRLVFAEILRALKECNYTVSSRMMNTAYFSVPQIRNRMIFVGVRSGCPSHPQPQSIPLTFQEAVHELSLDIQDSLTDHVWVDEVSKQTKWIGRAASLLPGEKLIHNRATGIRLRRNAPCATIMKNAPEGCAPYVRNSFVHPTEPRTPSIREMARCHSFPDEFRFVDPLRNGMHRIGNSVPPLFMRAIAEHLRDNFLRKA